MTKRIIWLGIALVLSFCSGCERNTNILTFIDDPATLLSVDARQRIENQAQSLLQHQQIQLLVAVLPHSTNDLDGQAVKIFAQHRLGEVTGAARGILLLIDPFSSQVRLEIGYDLECLFTDVFIARIEREQMAPFFTAGRIAHGIEASVELLVSHTTRADAGETNTAVNTNGSNTAPLSGGAGARSVIPVGSDLPIKDQVVDPLTFTAGTTPLDTLKRYRLSLQRRIKDPNLDIYTPATQQFFSQWLVTDGQQNNALRDLERGLPMAEVFEAEATGERLVVIRFPVSQRQNAPYFLRYSGYGWQLDFATMSRVLGFNHRNQWHQRSTDHPFGFAFSDWRFDNHGFPHEKK